MKKFIWHFLLLIFVLISCKKDRVDATDTKSFQSSINDMASSLPTIKQIKFNEALYILKTFGVDADGDIDELKALGKLLDGKNVSDIFTMADKVAKENNIDWSSTAPPSLGEMNIFGNVQAQERDPNDILAKSLAVNIKPIGNEESGVTSLQIIPRLLDNNNQPISFTGAALETILQVSNNGVKLLTSKNLMQDNNFKGFYLNFSSLPAELITDNKIDVTISVRTSHKTFKMSKIGIDVNPSALKIPVENIETDSLNINTDPTTDPNSANNSATPVVQDPKIAVSKFLTNLNNQNLKAAYESSTNPNWGSYENFSNPTSGFGTVKNIAIKNITTKSNSDNNATVNATYDVTDKNGKITPLNVNFGLKNMNGEWKISSYKIN